MGARSRLWTWQLYESLIKKSFIINRLLQFAKEQGSNLLIYVVSVIQLFFMFLQAFMYQKFVLSTDITECVSKTLGLILKNCCCGNWAPGAKKKGLTVAHIYAYLNAFSSLPPISRASAMPHAFARLKGRNLNGLTAMWTTCSANKLNQSPSFDFHCTSLLG